MGTRFAACKSKRKLICIVRAHSSILLFQSRWSWLAFTTIIRDFFTAVNLYLPVSTWRTRWNSFLKCCCVRISIYTHIYIYIHLNSVQRNYFILPIHFLSSSVERSTGSTSRNGEIAKVRRGTDGPLPQPGLQTIVQCPHPADRRRFLHSYRAARL